MIVLKTNSLKLIFGSLKKKESTSGTATLLGGITINLNEYISPIQDEIYFNVKNKKLPLNNQEDTKKKQTVKFTTKTKRGFSGQTFIEGDDDLDLTEASHELSELSTTSIIGKSRFSASGINSSNSSEGEHVIELQVENETLKRQYRELVVKHENEKRELEKTTKIGIEEKKKWKFNLRNY